jgi:hypothetical protein
MAPPCHLSSEPSLGNVPLSFGGGTRNAENFCGFFNGQAAKETQFDESALLLVDPGESLEGVVDGKYVRVGKLGHGEGGIELDLLARAALGGAAGACVVDENLAHEASSDSDKVGATASAEGVLPSEAQVGFMNQGSGLQGVAGALALQMMVSEGAEILVDQGDEGLQGVFVAAAPTGEKLTGDLRRVLGQRRSITGLGCR